MILVFKTDIADEAMLNNIRPHINRLLPDGVWNVDIEDCDHVLRVEHVNDITGSIVTMLSRLGINCEELQ